jgi:transcriptional regulator with XRE-family HTH domain
MNTIASRMVWLRESTGLNKVDFAEKIGVNQSTISRIEDGTQKPSADTLIALSHIFGISTDWILFGGPYQDKPSCESPRFLLKVDKELEPYIKKLNRQFHEGNRNFKGWIIIQLEKAFPEIAEEIKREHEKEETSG